MNGLNKFVGKNRVLLARVAVVALVAGPALLGTAAHATGGYDPNGNQTVVSATYATGDSVSNGATSQTVGFGNAIDQQMVAVDYAQIANIFLTRFTPALTVVALAGAVLIAARGGVKMIHGGLRGQFH